MSTQNRPKPVLEHKAWPSQGCNRSHPSAETILRSPCHLTRMLALLRYLVALFQSLCVARPGFSGMRLLTQLNSYSDNYCNVAASGACHTLHVGRLSISHILSPQCSSSTKHA